MLSSRSQLLQLSVLRKGTIRHVLTFCNSQSAENAPNSCPPQQGRLTVFKVLCYILGKLAVKL